MRCRWKNQHHINEEASLFHNKVRDLFANNQPFNTMKCYQEVPVIDLVPSYHSSLHRVDWYIETLGVVIELHGQQHYKMTNFGFDSWNQAHDKFLEGKARDSMKRVALVEAGFKYIEIPYRLLPKINAEMMIAQVFMNGD